MKFHLPSFANRSTVILRNRVRTFRDFVFRAAPDEFLGHISFVRQMQKKGLTINTVLDVGANSGHWSKWMSRFVQSNAHFYLVEPQIKFAPALSKIGTHFPIILSDKEKTVDFYSIGGTGDSYFVEMTSHYDKIRPVKVKSIAARDVEGIPKSIDLVKIDTQGSELDILKGFGPNISNIKLVILEVPVLQYNSGAPSFVEYMDFMSQQGFVPWGVLFEHSLDDRLTQFDIAFINKTVLASLAKI
jgi:FkbM family methyltransferase